ncbi:MAG: hypothetical protein Q4A43_01035 [Coriobacteriia bacterium]|nr:hypothetical protein [Coriobacteriia bacterium]
MLNAQSLHRANRRAALAAFALVFLASSFIFGARFAYAEEDSVQESADTITGQIEISQRNINKVGKQTRGGQCLCYSYAYAQTITTGSVHSWSEYSAGGVSARWFPNLFSYKTYGSERSTLQAVRKAVTKGKPVVLHLKMSKGGQHWVAVTGYVGTDASNLKLSDFLALDSVGTLPDEPVAISEKTYSLYLDSNNVRISKSAGTFVADGADAASVASAGEEEGSAEAATSPKAGNGDAATADDIEVTAAGDGDSPATGTDDAAEADASTSSTTADLSSFTAEERKIIEQRSDPTSGANPTEGVVTQFVASLVA